MRWVLALSMAAYGLLPMTSRAEVHDSTSAGFAVRATATVPASADEVWDILLDPAEWWNGTHTFSGKASNLSLDPRAGGCFCEVLPDATSAEAPPRGGVQHMQVLHLEKPRILRLSGALGPLQSEPVTGTLTFMIKPEETGTRINAEYTVGGYMRIPSERMAPIVDKVIGEQVARLAAKLGGTVSPDAPAAAPADAPRSPIIGR